MATNHTENYGLNLWEADDTFLRTEFNENSQKLDAALKAETDARAAGDAALQTAVNGKATTAALNALTQTVNGKADASTVTALTQTVNGKATTAALNALTQTVNGKADASAVTTALAQKADTSALAAKYGPDNVPWVMGTYTGTGTAQGDTQDITLGFRPKLLILAGDCGGLGVGVTYNGTSRSVGFAVNGLYMQPINEELTLTDTGFRVKMTNNNSHSINRKGYVLIYFALR